MMISRSENSYLAGDHFLTLEEERELFHRRDLLSASLENHPLDNSRKEELRKQIHQLTRGMPTSILLQRSEQIAGRITSASEEFSFCCDECSLTALFMTIQEHFLPLVRKLARTHQHPGIDIEDLKQAAILGLQEAIIKYRPGNLTFGRYASWAIRNSMKKELQVSMCPLRMPKGMVENFKAIKKAYDELSLHSDAMPSVGALSRQAATGKKTAAAFLMSRQKIESIRDDHAVSHRDPLSEVVHGNLSDIAMKIIESIEDSQSRRILEMTFGIGLDRPRTLQEIAIALGYNSRTSVFHKKQSILRELRQRFRHLQEEMGDEWVAANRGDETLMVC